MDCIEINGNKYNKDDVIKYCEWYSEHEVKQEFEEMLTELHPPISILGLSYEVGDALKCVDPLLFNMEFNNWVSEGDIFVEIDEYYYRIEDIEANLKPIEE